MTPQSPPIVPERDPMLELARSRQAAIESVVAAAAVPERGVPLVAETVVVPVGGWPKLEVAA